MNLQSLMKAYRSLLQAATTGLHGLLWHSAQNSFPGCYQFIWLCFFWTGTPEKRELRSQEGSAAYPRWPPHGWQLCNWEGYSRSAQRVIRVQFISLRGKTKSAVFLLLQLLWSLILKSNNFIFWAKYGISEHQLGILFLLWASQTVSF